MRTGKIVHTIGVELAPKELRKRPNKMIKRVQFWKQFAERLEAKKQPTK